MKLINKNKSFAWKDKMNEKGSVTIFLTLLMVVLLTVFLATIEIVRYEQAKGRCEHLAVGAVEHIMADYEVELANRYHLYVLDKTYLGQGEETGTHRVWNYLEQNIGSIDVFGHTKGFYSFQIADVQLEPQIYLYSNGCQSLKEQIHNWFVHSMLSTYERISRREQKQSAKGQGVQQNRIGIKAEKISIICNNHQERNTRGIRQEQKLKEKQEQNSILLCKSKKPGASKPGASKPGASKPGASKPGTSKPGTSKPGASKPGTSKLGASKPGASKPGASKPGASKPGASKPGASKPGTSKPGASKPIENKPVKPEQDQNAIQELLKKLDPRQAMEKIKRNGILSVATNSYLPLSMNKIGDNQLPSDILKWEGKTSSLLEKAKNKIELETYIFQHFNSALSIVTEEETAYQNEIEYLIAGKNNDYDCLEIVAKEIVAIRLPLNYVAIQKDSKKVAQVRNIATIICTLLEQPEAIGAVTRGILVAWAFGESVADVKCLLQGDKIPMIKESKDWHLSFYQLFYIRYVSVKGSDKGETYEDYLKKLLLLVSEKKLYMRMLDLLELNVALQEPEFYIENSMTKWKVDIQIEADVRLFQLPMARRNSYLFSISKIGEYQF